MRIPTEGVGSLPRSSVLQAALAAYDCGAIDHAQLVHEQDIACLDSLRRMEQTEAPIISDGEQRESSFATYCLADTLAGTGLADHLVFDGGQYFAIFDDGHKRQLPRLIGGPFRYKLYAGEYVAKARPLTSRQLSQGVVTPSMLSLLYPLDGELPGYPREQFLSDVCAEVEKDIRSCFAAGAARVSLDFTEGRLACKNDPRNPWTGRGLLESFIALNNRVLDRFTAEERTNIGVHTCPGGDCDSTHSAEIDYANLLPALFQLNAGYFLIQAASELDSERVYQLVGKYSRHDANGVLPVYFLGVTNPQDPRVETPEEIRDALLLAARYIPEHRIGSTDDCGFSPFSIDGKPRHDSPDHARDIAFQKIAARVQGTALASSALGMQ
jgi:methionine synthase II (cobalamin-independent)